MSAIPDQTYEGWIHNLRTVAGLDPEHISAYSLIIEEGTPFASRTLNLPDEDAEYNMYEATAQILREYGFEQYEISNYAKKGRECRHNVGYWIRQDYLGFGLGASSLYGKERFANTQDMKKFKEAKNMGPYVPDICVKKTEGGGYVTVKSEGKLIPLNDAEVAYLRNR